MYTGTLINDLMATVERAEAARIEPSELQATLAGTPSRRAIYELMQASRILPGGINGGRG